MSRTLHHFKVLHQLFCHSLRWNVNFSSRFIRKSLYSSIPNREFSVIKEIRRAYTSSTNLQETSIARQTLISNSPIDSLMQKRNQNVEQALIRLDLNLKAYGRVNRDEVESIVKEAEESKGAITSRQGLYLVHSCGNCLSAEEPEYRSSLVQKIWDLLISSEVPLDISHFNALLRVHLENEYSFNPLKFLASIIEQDIQPNRVTYQRLVAAYCQKGDLDGASKILSIMKHKDIAIDAIVFNAIVMGHSVIGDWDSANGVIETMVKNGLEPDVDTYAQLLSGYARHGELNRVTLLIETCQKKDIQFSDNDLLEAYYTAAVHGHPEVGDILLNHMRKNAGYNRSCVSVILRLVTKRKESESFKILLTMKPRLHDGRATPSGRFFIRHVVRSDCPPEKIISFCQQLVQSGKNVRAFFTAIEAASSLEKHELVERLLKEMKSDKNSVKSHFLGPLLTSESRIGGEQKVLDMLRKMAAVRVFPNVETVKRHILPHMTGDSQTLLQKLHSSRVSFFVISLSLLQKSLESHDFEDAIRIASTFYIDMDPKLLNAAAGAYLQSRNADGLAKLIRVLLPAASEHGECDPRDLSSEIIGPVFKEICKQTPKSKRHVTLVPLLEALREQGLSISLSLSQYLREALDEETLSSTVVDLLAELSSGELIPIELDPCPSRLHWTSKPQVVKMRQDFSRLARERKLDEALACKKELEAQSIPFTDGMNLLLIDLYTQHGQLDDAMTVFSQLFRRKPDLIVFPGKLMGFATQLLKGDRITDALYVLQQLKTDPRVEETAELNNIVNANALRLMNTAAEKSDAKTIQKIFERLEESKALKMNKSLLGPLVKVHVIRDDLEGALQEFDRCSKKLRATPMNTELAARLIEKDDTKRLERLMRSNKKVHGEMNSLYDLALAFLRCNRVSQAKKVLETPGMRALNKRLNDVCAHYVRQNRIEELENFVKITKNLFNVDRSMLYNHLLSACIRADKPVKALSLWTLIQEEGNFVPADDFLRRLGDFLTTKHMTVPFALPVKSKSAPTQ